MASELQPTNKGELEPVTPRFSLADTLRTQLVSADEKATFLPIGGIIFNHGKSALALGSDALGKVVVGRVDELPEGVDPQQAIEGEDRILNLSDFDGVQVLQAGIAGVQVRTHRSIKTFPSVGIAINVEDRETMQTGPHRIEEKEILELFAGERGGIVVFSGYDLPEDNALLFERNVGEKRDAKLLFIKPSDSDQSVDSVEGVYQLLRNLNTEFKNNAPMPLQDQAVHALDKTVSKGQIAFHGSEVREEIYRTHIIALARLAEKTGDQKYTDQLERGLPALKENLVTRIFNLGSEVPTEVVDGRIDGLIKSRFAADTKPIRVEAEIVHNDGIELSLRDKKIHDDLQLETSRRLWKSVAEKRYYRSDNDQSRFFLRQLIAKIYEAKVPQDFADSRTLINALFSSDYKDAKISLYGLHLGDSRGSITFYDSNSVDSYGNVSDIQEQLIDQLDKFEASSLY